MLAIGRVSPPLRKLLMLDEPSMGLAPTTADLIFDRLIEIRRQTNLTILLVEQRVAEALETADHGYVLEPAASRSKATSRLCVPTTGTTGLSRHVAVTSTTRIGRTIDEPGQEIVSVPDAADGALGRSRHGIIDWTVERRARPVARGGESRPDRAALRHLYPAGPGDEMGAEMGIEHINAKGGIKSLGEPSSNSSSSIAATRRESQECRAAHGGPGNELVAATGSYLSSFTLATTEVTERAQLPMLTLSYSGPDHRSRLQIHLPDRGDREPAIGARPSRTDEACRNRVRQAAENGRDDHGTTRRHRSRPRKHSRKSSSHRKPSTRGRRSLDAATVGCHAG